MGLRHSLKTTCLVGVGLVLEVVVEEEGHVHHPVGSSISTWMTTNTLSDRKKSANNAERRWSVLSKNSARNEGLPRSSGKRKSLNDSKRNLKTITGRTCAKIYSK